MSENLSEGEETGQEWYSDDNPMAPYRAGETYYLTFFLGRLGGIIAQHPTGKIVTPIGNALLKEVEHGDICRVLIRREQDNKYVGSITEIARTREDIANKAQLSSQVELLSPEETEVDTVEAEMAETEMVETEMDTEKVEKALASGSDGWIGPETVTINVFAKSKSSSGGKKLYGLYTMQPAIAKIGFGKGMVVVEAAPIDPKTGAKGKTRRFLGNVQRGGKNKTRIYLGTVPHDMRGNYVVARYRLVE